MGLFQRSKTVKDYVRQIIRLASVARKEIPRIYETGNIQNIERVLRLIQHFDKEQFYLIESETGSVELMEECRTIHRLAQEALEAIENYYEFDKAAQVFDQIIALEGYIQAELPKVIRFVPSKVLRMILDYSPKQAASSGFLFRGLSERDYQKIVAGKDLFAVAPEGDTTLLQHILDPTNSPATPFISLTADINVARHFGQGRVVAVRRSALQGEVLGEAQIRQRLGYGSRREVKGRDRSNALRLVRKNTEFILAPTRASFARIPAAAMVR